MNSVIITLLLWCTMVYYLCSQCGWLEVFTLYWSALWCTMYVRSHTGWLEVCTLYWSVLLWCQGVLWFNISVRRMTGLRC